MTSWTSVRTWGSEVLTSILLNLHLRDNTQHLYEQKGNPRAYVAKVALYTTTVNDGLINCTSGTFTVTLLPAATGGAAFTQTIKNSGTGIITVAANGAETIDGAPTVTLFPGESITVGSTGASWYVPASYVNASPLGTVIESALRSSPSAAWLRADGTAYSRTTYASLFSAIVPSLGTFTVTLASPGVFTLNSHGLVAGDQVYFTTTGALPTGLSANTLYYVISAGLTTNAFEVSATRGGAAVNTSGSQSGTHTARVCPWGLGDGSTTFNVPDRRGAGGIGSGTGSGLTARPLGQFVGEETHQLTTAELASHTHTQTAHAHGAGSLGADSGGAHTHALNDNSAGGGSAGELSTGCGGSGSPQTTASGGAHTHTVSGTSGSTTAVNNNAGSDTAHNNMQPSLVMSYFIKAF
jgi:microcystin-dependent protein